MKRILITTTMLLAGTAALAQTAPVALPPATPTAPAAPTAPAPMAHPMADKVMTRAEVVTTVREHFSQLDANKDGAVTTAEVVESRGTWGGHRKEMGTAPKGDPNAAFDRLDTNRDGSISRDEFAKGREQRIEKRVEIRKQRQEAGKDGKDGQKQAWRMHRGMGGTRMIVMADTNKDGKITLPEAEAMALQHFDQMDANHDGQVTPEERRASRPTMIKRMQAPSAG